MQLLAPMVGGAVVGQRGDLLGSARRRQPHPRIEDSTLDVCLQRRYNGLVSFSAHGRRWLTGMSSGQVSCWSLLEGRQKSHSPLKVS